MKQSSIGITVGRFQVPELHAGHRYLLDYIAERHDTVVVVIGSHTSLETAKNPLPVEERHNMIEEYLPHSVILSLRDWHNDAIWSSKLDELIEETFPNADVTLYGSRDSFLGHYQGQRKTCVVPPISVPSGSDIRDDIATFKEHDTTAFRAGMIHNIVSRIPLTYMTTDVAILNPSRTQVLLRRKPEATEWCFIGGFFDTTDRSFEESARREVREETGITHLVHLQYLGNTIIDDHRYRGTPDSIRTMFYCAMKGDPHEQETARDDIAEIQWHPIPYLSRVIATFHQPLADMLIQHISRENV